MRHALLRGVSLVAISGFVGPAIAQSDTMETVTVTGIRASLSSAQAIKQNADTFVDSISAEDIGALPDASVTETLARIPGVSINRFAGTNDPDHFSAEGSGIVIQGLSYVRSELNGRDTFGANNGRSLGFADVAPELLTGVDVFKNESADMIEGGLAGTVNLRTRVPFDAPDLLIAGSVAGAYSDFADKWEPSVTALVSDRWRTKNLGEFGLLLSGVDSRLDQRADGDQASNFACRQNLSAGVATGNTLATCPAAGSTPAGPGVWFPRGAAFRTDTYHRERIGAAAAIQWQNDEHTMEATFQFLRSDYRNAWTEHAVEIATDNVTSNGDSRPVTGTTFQTNSDGVFTNGVITGPTGWQADGAYNWQAADCSSGGCDPRSVNFGNQSNDIRRDVKEQDVTSDYGGNFKWTPNDTWAFNLDLQHVFSTTHVVDAGIWGSTYQNTSLNIAGANPIIHFVPPGVDGTLASQACTTISQPGQTPHPEGTPQPCTTFLDSLHPSYSDPANTFWRSAMDHIEQSRGTEDALKFDADYHFPSGGWLQMVRVGARLSDRDQTIRYTKYNWGVLSEQWGGNGPVWMSDPLPGTPQANGYPTGSGPLGTAYTQLYSFPDFFRGRVPLPTGSQARPFYAFNTVQNYAAYSTLGLLIGDTWRARYNSPNPPSNTNNCTPAAGGLQTPTGTTPENWVPLNMRCGAVNGSPFIPGEISPERELTTDAYFMLKFGQDLGAHTFGGNVGLRYFSTEHKTTGTYDFSSLSALPTETVGSCLATPPQPGQPPTTFVPPSFCNQSAATKALYRAFVASGSPSSVAANTTYDYFLPSLNLKFNITDDMLLRFAASKGVSLPDMGLTREFLSLGTAADIAGTPPTWGGLTATGGNPFLKPVRANMFDLSYEWYFAKVGSLTGAVFYKELRDVISNSSALVPFTNNGATVNIYVTRPQNSPKVGTVKGFEIAFQRVFDFLPSPFDGLGVNGNYAWIASSGVPQSILNASDPQVASQVAAGNVSNVDTSKLPLQGLSKHNLNAEVFYEKGPISTRLAYNWRSKFLLTTADVIVPYAPIMNEASGELDGSAFYTINDNIKVGVEGVNLLDTITRTSQVLAATPKLLTAPRSSFINDRRVTFTIRANF